MHLQDMAGPSDCSPRCCGKVMTPAGMITKSQKTNVWLCLECGKTLSPKKHHNGVQGEVSIQLIDAATGEVVHSSCSSNIFTDVGRNYLAALISYMIFSQPPGVEEPATSKRRFDGVRYMMVGKGTQNETNAVAQLNDPVPFNSAGQYMAQVIAPNELPGSAISAVFQRVYGTNEISVPSTVDISEVGLFVAGPTSSPVSLNDQYAAPIAYNTFPAIPKSSAFMFSVRWEIKF